MGDKMYMADNKFETAKKYMATKLESYYSPHEIEHFFWIVSEDLLKINRIDLIKDPNLRLTESQMLHVIGATKSLLRNIPIQYITQKATFFGYDFFVNSHVLIPRPETEELVSWILSNELGDSNLKVIDLGTGSGCIPITLKNERKNWEVTGVDISKDALTVAKQNSLKHDAKVDFVFGDILNFELPNELFDVVVSNPPYVLESEKKQMLPNVLNNEPHIALFVPDEDPLRFYKKIAQWALQHLKLNGNLYFEINEAQGNAMHEMLIGMGFVNVTQKLDIFDKPRMIKASKCD